MQKHHSFDSSEVIDDSQKSLDVAPSIIYNPSLCQESRYEPAAIIPVKQKSSILDWLKTTNRLIPRDAEDIEFSLRQENEIEDLIDLDDYDGYNNDDDFGIDEDYNEALNQNTENPIQESDSSQLSTSTNNQSKNSSKSSQSSKDTENKQQENQPSQPRNNQADNSSQSSKDTEKNQEKKLSQPENSQTEYSSNLSQFLPSDSDPRKVSKQEQPSQPKDNQVAYSSNGSQLDRVDDNNYTLHTPPLTQEQQQRNRLNEAIENNPQLLRLRQESNLEKWNQLVDWINVDWINEDICGLNLQAARNSAERLKRRYSGESNYNIAHTLIVHKSLQVAGVDLIKGIPLASFLIEQLANIDLPKIAKLSAEMVYQIYIIYNWNLFSIDLIEVETQILLTFAATLLGEKAIELGIDWLGLDSWKAIGLSASAKALMIYAIGNTACLYYENKQRDLLQDSQLYLQQIESEEQIEEQVIEIINYELEHYFSIDYSQLEQYLSQRQWKKADQETKKIIFQLTSRNEQEINYDSLSQLPSSDLKKINKLWLKHSQGHFGLSVQCQIYYELNKDIGRFGEEVGWRGEAGRFNGAFAWKDYTKMNFNLEGKRGHLPAFWLDIKEEFVLNGGDRLNKSLKAVFERDDWLSEKEKEKICTTDYYRAYHFVERAMRE